MPDQSRFIVTLTDAATEHPERVLAELHAVVKERGSVLDQSPEDRELIANLGMVVIEAPNTIEPELRATKGVAQVNSDSLRMVG